MRVNTVRRMLSLYLEHEGTPVKKQTSSLKSMITCVIAMKNYPFTAPAVIPSIKYFWKATNSTKIGSIEKKEPTINRS